jgi:hypothetical protein
VGKSVSRNLLPRRHVRIVAPFAQKTVAKLCET